MQAITYLTIVCFHERSRESIGTASPQKRYCELPADKCKGMFVIDRMGYTDKFNRIRQDGTKFENDSHNKDKTKIPGKKICDLMNTLYTTNMVDPCAVNQLKSRGKQIP